MSTRRRLLPAATFAAVSTLATLAACGRATTEPSTRALAPAGVSLRRGADDSIPRQEPQPGDDRGGARTTTTSTSTTTTTSTTDDKGQKRHGADDPANHG